MGTLKPKLLTLAGCLAVTLIVGAGSRVALRAPSAFHEIQPRYHDYVRRIGHQHVPAWVYTDEFLSEPGTKNFRVFKEHRVAIARLRDAGKLIEPYDRQRAPPNSHLRFQPLPGDTAFENGSGVRLIGNDIAPDAYREPTPWPISESHLDLNANSRSITILGERYTVVDLGGRVKQVNRAVVRSAFEAAQLQGFKDLVFELGGKLKSDIEHLRQLVAVLDSELLYAYTLAHPDMLPIDVAMIAVDEERSDATHRLIALRGWGHDLNRITPEQLKAASVATVSVYLDALENFDIPPQVADIPGAVYGYRGVDPLPFHRRTNISTARTQATLAEYERRKEGRVVGEITRIARFSEQQPGSLPSGLMDRLFLEQLELAERGPHPAELLVICYPLDPNRGGRPPEIVMRLGAERVGLLDMHHGNPEELVVLDRIKNPQHYAELKRMLRGSQGP